jgi:hypothetical protein
MTKNQQTYAIVGGSLIALYMIIKAFKDDEDTQIEKIDKQPTGDGSTVPLTGGRPFTDAMASSVAQTLHDYMRYCGTDEDGIIVTLSQGFNGKALQKIYKAFGRRKAAIIAGCHGDALPFTGTQKDLGAYLRAELSGEPELDAIRTIFKKANINI